MTEYEAGLPVEVAFPPEDARSLAQAFSEAGWRQFHVAETEKYAHVTYFFNGGVEAPFPARSGGSSRAPRSRPTTSQPEMSAVGVTDALVEAIGSGDYDFIVANFANPDMVGHTGVWDATLAALETIDACLGRVVAAIEAVDADDPTAPGALLAITADHGNADAAARRRRQPGHGPLAQPGAVRPRRAGGPRPRASTTASWPTSHRPCSSSPACRAGTG